jgi:hypothetical protein
MKSHLLPITLLYLLCANANGDPTKTLVAEDSKLGVKVWVSVEAPGKILPQLKNNQETTVDVHFEITDVAGKIIWSKGCSCDGSGPSGDKIGVSFAPELSALLIHEYGYRGDQEHRLLFLTHGKDGQHETRVIDYKSARTDLLPLLANQPEYDKTFEYEFQATEFSKKRVVFKCRAYSKTGGRLFSATVPVYAIVAEIKDGSKIVPVSIELDQ